MKPGAQIYFCFADPPGFSGQKAATEMVIRGLASLGWRCVRRPQPVLDRSEGGSEALVRYLIGLLAAWGRGLSLVLARGSWLNVNLGQTRMAFVRDAVPLLLGRLGLGRERIVISLHGSPFMRWERNSRDARIFRFLLNQAGRVTVLGERQQARLIELGVSAERVTVLVNTCVLEGARPRLYDKCTVGSPVRFLHLSSLIDTKGYDDYLEALALLSSRPGRRIEAVLCGEVTISEFAERFHDGPSAEAWIELKLAEINRSERVTVRWVRGATGVGKTRLYESADIFVLPTRYAVEAQPLVLLEAMAAGCAIVATRAGEIETILDEQSACFVEAGSAERLATSLSQLIENVDLRTRMAQNAQQRFYSHYSLEHHLDAWERLLATPT